VDDATLAAIDLVLEEGALPNPTERILREGWDGALRAQRARAVDAAASVES
jgi:hypothetical protein